jgi:hypothetical protein
MNVQYTVVLFYVGLLLLCVRVCTIRRIGFNKKMDSGILYIYYQC